MHRARMHFAEELDLARLLQHEPDGLARFVRTAEGDALRLVHGRKDAERMRHPVPFGSAHVHERQLVAHARLDVEHVPTRAHPVRTPFDGFVELERRRIGRGQGNRRQREAEEKAHAEETRPRRKRVGKRVPAAGFTSPAAFARLVLVLASASPRRARLLAEAGVAFRVWAPGVDETVAPGTPPSEAAVQLGLRKAQAVRVVDGFVLAADTLLDLDQRILGKPVDEADARRILRALSGRAHRVITGVCARNARTGESAAASATTTVSFRPLSDAEIAAYVATGEPMDKAGAYAVQGGARGFVASMEGPADNVVGLPVALALRLLRDVGWPG